MEPTIANFGDEKLASEALARVKGQLAALLPEQLLQVNLEVQPALATALGALPEIRAFREQIVKELPAFDVVAFDSLEDYVLALSAAQATFQIATQPGDDLEPLAAEGQKLREILLAEAKVLSLRGLIDKHKLENLKGATSRMNIAQDLQALSTMLLDSWPQMQGKTQTTQDDLLKASRIGTRLTRLVGARDQGPAVVAAATDQRQRAFTLLFHTYEETRAAIGYLRRREEDLDSIAPNLYSSTGKRRASGDAEVPTGPQPPAAGTSGSSSAQQANPNLTGTQAVISPSAAAAAMSPIQNGQPTNKDPFLA